MSDKIDLGKKGKKNISNIKSTIRGNVEIF